MNDEKLWYNQQVFIYFDENPSIKNLLNINLTLSTQDFTNFSQLNILLSISSDKKKYLIVLNYQNAKEIFLNIQRQFKENKKIEIYKKFGKRALNIKMINENYTTFEIIYGTEENGFISLHNSEFKSIYSIFGNYINNYLNLTTTISTSFLNSQILQHSVKTSNELRHILVKLDRFNVNIPDMTPRCAAPHTQEQEINDFVRENEQYAELPDMSFLEKKEKEEKVEIDTKEYFFIDKFKMENIDEFLELLIAISTSKFPLEAFLSSTGLEEYYREDIENGSYLEDLNIEDIKLLSYFPQKTYNENLRRCLKEDKKLPSKMGIIKYKPKLIDDRRENITNELFTIMICLKIAKDKISVFEKDVHKNYSLHYMAIRYFLDPIIFSFIQKMNPEERDAFTNHVISKYELYLKMFNGLENMGTKANIKKEDVKKEMLPFLIVNNRIVNSVKTIYESLLSNNIFEPLTNNTNDEIDDNENEEEQNKNELQDEDKKIEDWNEFM